MKHWLIMAVILAGFCGPLIWIIDHPPCRYVPKAQHCNDGEVSIVIAALVLVAALVGGSIYATRWLKDRDR